VGGLLIPVVDAAMLPVTGSSGVVEEFAHTNRARGVMLYEINLMNYLIHLRVEKLTNCKRMPCFIYALV